MPQLSRSRILAASAVLLALLATPAPLLPPHHLAALLEAMLGVGWKAAYLIAAFTTQAAFYGALGLAAAFTVNRATTPRGRWTQVGTMPVVVVGVALLIRSAKVGHLPLWSNAAVPTVACMCGVWLGLGLLHRRTLAAALTIAAAMGWTAWSLLGGASASVSAATGERLRHLVAAGPELPQGEPRFGALLRASFEGVPLPSGGAGAVEANRAAILAWGIVVGHEGLARFVGLDSEGNLVRQASALRAGTTLRGREDWARHYALSAALSVLEHPLVSDAAGLLKEQLDALSGGSGFSFGDLAADRAGVRFAEAATRSESAAAAMRAQLERGVVVDDYFPPFADLPENLTTEEFRRRFGEVGSEQFRGVVAEIDRRLERTAALKSP